MRAHHAGRSQSALELTLAKCAHALRHGVEIYERCRVGSGRRLPLLFLQSLPLPLPLRSRLQQRMHVSALLHASQAKFVNKFNIVLEGHHAVHGVVCVAFLHAYKKLRRQVQKES